MSIRQATPGGSGRAKPDHFSYFWTEPSQPWTGWVAGPVRWVKGHTEPPPTKPCLRWITFDALPCPRCKPNEIASDVGYLGIYRELDNAPILVVLHDNMWDATQNLKHGEYVRLSRPGGPKGTVTCQQLLAKKPFVPGLARRKVAVDLSSMLVKMWSINELIEWYNCQDSSGTMVPVTKVSPPDPATAKSKKAKLDVSRIAGILDVNAAANRAQADREEANAKFLRDHSDAERNGKPGDPH